MIFRTLIFSLLLVVSGLQSELTSQASLYYTQDRQTLGNSIKESIAQAKNSILIFTFTLSDAQIIDILNKKAEEGLSVTVVIDKDHMAEIVSKRSPKLEIVTRRSGEGHLHHKILVVDGRDIWIGSANFTTSAYVSQENMMVRFDSEELGTYLLSEVDAFRGTSNRSPHGPLQFSLTEQLIDFCLLPHDGFPPKKIEKAINDQSKERLIQTIKNAKHSIKIAMMVWTNHDLTYAIIEAQRRGVKVQVLSQDLGGNIPQLKNAGIEVKVNPKFSLMHNKMMWVDDRILVTGSANWSQSSFTRNDESFIILEPMTEHQISLMNHYWSYLFQ